MTNFLIDIFDENGLSDVVYVEPYAGGAGAAINLLLNNHVNEIVINDANIGVYSFWNALINESEHFIETLEVIPVTLSEWHHQKEVLRQSKKPSFELGVATFFLSRTNRSGVISAGAIGGSTEEKQAAAKYKIDCRFNKEELIPRLKAIATQKKRIVVKNQDAIALLHEIDDGNFVYLDPPYYVKGRYLYMNHYTDSSHRELANILQNQVRFKWLLSYDDVPQIREMYRGLELYRFPLSYSVKERQIGYELLTHSRNISLPKSKTIRRNQKGHIILESI